MPTVSVVLPTYNRGARLGRAVDSVLAQRVDDIEVIVVDDGSNDQTEAVVDSFDDPRVNYMAHRENLGGAAARNTGIEASTGEYVAFLDDDDEWLPHKLENQLQCLSRRSEEWIAAYCDYRVKRHGAGRGLKRLVGSLFSENASDTYKHEGGAELIPKVLSKNLKLGGASTLIAKRNAVESIGGFDPEFARHQDWEFLVRLLHAGKLAYVDQEMVVKHESKQPSPESLREAKSRFFAKFQSDIDLAEQKGYDVTGIHRLDLACSYYKEGHFVQGTQFLSGAKFEPVTLLRALCIGLYSTTNRVISF
ncbi:glycosyltransferase family 2 protein [Haloarcula sp. 1CSR25-25]|uniref:glycosyltransferase family 2 protein n=1 Tax=Haloarcula sp. 1CSR25-25 TaxID=2862545 RepID=UPI002894587B|nr:glycosyltransferase family 2 protein [Haloarcula sp. 1CSR25-25]MDT3435479.1 glycosyltransferase family 2 protein [Haloarcula sp. 1CSR25-25]